MIRAVKLSFAFLTIVIMSGSAAARAVPPDTFIFPDAALKETIAQMDEDRLISSLYQAFETLTALGGEDILVCRVQRIEAPLGGYLIDGLLQIELEGQEYSTFRIGISDSDSPFALIARGINDEGETIWYPDPGPDYVYQTDEIMQDAFFEYEFLIDRDNFENLEIEFNRSDAESSGEEEGGNAN